MKGLDLFLVLLVLLSWRRCTKSQGVLCALVTATTVVCAGAVLVSTDVDSSKSSEGSSAEEFRNENKSGGNDAHYDERLRTDPELYTSKISIGLPNPAHYFYAHGQGSKERMKRRRHDNFEEDEEDSDDYEEEDDDDDDDNDDPVPSWFIQNSGESMRRKILEHRQLRAYLRNHHKQHVKRHRMMLLEENERQEDLSSNSNFQTPKVSDQFQVHSFGRARATGAEEIPENFQAITTTTTTTTNMNISVGAMRHEDLEKSSLGYPESHAHHYNHDLSWKPRNHAQHNKGAVRGLGRRMKEKMKPKEIGMRRDQKLQHNKNQDTNSSSSTRQLTTPFIKTEQEEAIDEEKEHHKNFHIAPNKVFRHSNRFLDKFYMDTEKGFLDPDNLNSIDLNVSTISELIWKLRGMRSRRRRSSFNQTLIMPPMNSGSASAVSKSTNTIIDSTKLLQSNVTWPQKKIAEIEGDIWLGGLMMVHEREDNITCGPIMPQGGVQSLETMLFTIDEINRRRIIPGVKIGAYILDDCDKDTYGLEQAVDFIKGSISNIDDVDLTTTCAEGDSNKHKHRVIAGVVGAASSVTSIQVANLLRLFKIPQVSYFSTSPELSNKQRFEYFSRTIPSDKHQVNAMVEIVKKFKWQYVSIVYEESNYGIKAFEELERLLPENGICIAAKEKLVKDSGVAGEDSYERIVEKIVSGKAKGVIVYGSDQEVKELMRAVRKRNETGSFAWIGSDGWSARTLVSDGNEREVEGTLSVQPKANPVRGFDTYFLNLNVTNNTRNPWFVEFWENHWQCKFPNSSRTPYNLDYNKTCTGGEAEKLTSNNTVFEAQLQYVSDAVLAFAYALKDMHRVKCEGKPGLCAKMNPVDGTELLEYLRRVKFDGLSKDSFHFDEWGDGPARYNIIHFRRREDSGAYHWTRVGEYNEGVLTLNMSGVMFADGSSTPPTSICSKPCGLGEATRYVSGDKCCWSCLKCVGEQIRHPSDEKECVICPMGTLPNAEHTVCDEIKEEYLRYSDGWAIGAMTFAGVGCILTTAVIGVFVAHNDTPVVRASGRELSYVILIGLFFCYSLTFLFIIRPNDWICGVQQFMTGFVFTVVYAALLTKTNRIARIFEAGKKSAKRPSFISPRSQLIICSMMVSIQVLINVVWMLLQPPKAKPYYPTRQDNFLVCEAYINHSYAIAFWYPLLIICVCTIYAVLTRKIPEAFNESKYIGFTMYTTCIIWLAFVPIYFSTGTQVALRVTSMTVAISLSAYVMLACLFVPKLYIIICHPERNIRQSMMAPAARYSTIASTAATGGVAGGPASLNASTLGGGGAITPIQMTALKQNHYDNASTKTNSALVKVDRGTQCERNDDNERGHQNGTTPNSGSNSVSNGKDSRNHQVPEKTATTISTQTEDACSSNKTGKCENDLQQKQQQHHHPPLPLPPCESHKLCNHDRDHNPDKAGNCSVSETEVKSSQTAGLGSSGDVTTTTAVIHPQQQHPHHQRPRPQRISFRKETDSTTPNQQNRSNRNAVSGGDSNKVTIIVAKDSGDVLL